MSSGTNKTLNTKLEASEGQNIIQKGSLVCFPPVKCGNCKCLLCLLYPPQHPAGGWTWRRTVGSANIHQVKIARYFEVETITVYDPQRDGRFLWLEPPGKALGGGWGLSQPIWISKDRGKVFWTGKQSKHGQKELVQRHQGCG